LTLTGPTDGSRVSASSATVSGIVRPAQARVQVLGQRVSVNQHGRFATRVELAVGANLIDVEASAPRSVGAVSAVQVVRFLLVTVPQLDGESPPQAAAALKSLGLAVVTHGSNNPFNFLIPGSTQVCSTSPSAGTRVDPGATVTLATGKICGF
jgi:hypothetical protein